MYSWQLAWICAVSNVFVHRFLRSPQDVLTATVGMQSIMLKLGPFCTAWGQVDRFLQQHVPNIDH